MFALRDFGAASKEAVLALAEGFGDASALFRYVLSSPFLLPLVSTSIILRLVYIFSGTSPYLPHSLNSLGSLLVLTNRHEVAYIFGQLCSPHSVPSLLHVLRDQKEDDMVRHEAAEALGGIASDGAEEKGEDVLAILREWAVKEDAPVVVRESCQVAIDMWEVSLFSSSSRSLISSLSSYSSSRTLSSPIF
jgi:deoxyhypusine monooxygenase